MESLALQCIQTLLHVGTPLSRHVGDARTQQSNNSNRLIIILASFTRQSAKTLTVKDLSAGWNEIPRTENPARP
jgi:hypothetical protein